MASAPNTPDTPQPPRPSGDLEHLFRQKFAEAEVTPRAGFWDQLDHELVAQQHEQVLRQNTLYRQRAATYRWVAAACLLLALGFGSWAFLNQSGPGAAPPLAARHPASISALPTESDPYGTGLTSAPPVAGLGLGYDTATGTLASAPDETTTLAATAAAGQRGRLGNLVAALYAADGGAVEGLHAGSGHAQTYAGGFEAFFAGQGGRPGNSSESAFLSNFGGLLPRSSALRRALGLRRPDTLKPALAAAPVAPLNQEVAAVEEQPKPTAKLWKRLRLGGSYAVGAFNPNINFSRTDARTNADALTNALRTYYQDEAENEYRRNLRAGLSQRVVLTASYALGRHWTVASGLEAAEQRATSATTYGFLDGKQVGSESAAIFGRPAAYSAPVQPRTTSYRYRTAAVPVSVAYGSSHKPGLSLYAKVGAVVSVLLNSRSELEGAQAVTRKYSLKSAESPYRPVFASVRGGAGIRYQPVLATWNVAVGPTAETFVTTLNANPTQRAMNQSRPYSIGMEASLEFGGTKPMPGVQ
ncbi:hypothetical protein KLP40_17650 [Hymenobacter sp. NST-14]|uniref:hypothetical protein n=1 Tax=Hymenobacter piscis TaxID=2839984 RepID=UPI001C02CAF1|nr:hypothetical protein [Hymenobacter piscis]MBT9394995.1 hypothetical protein [Hymenobacter piscis]